MLEKGDMNTIKRLCKIKGNLEFRLFCIINYISMYVCTLFFLKFMTETSFLTLLTLDHKIRNRCLLD